MKTQLVLLAAEGHNPPPLIDLDNTIFIQFGLFIVLLIFLTKFVFRPYLHLRAERFQNIDGAREEAEIFNQDADQKLQTYEEKISSARKEAAALRATLRQEGEAQATTRLSSAHDEANTKIEEARQQIERTTDAARLSLRTRADQLAKAVALKLLGREV